MLRFGSSRICVLLVKLSKSSVFNYRGLKRYHNISSTSDSPSASPESLDFYTMLFAKFIEVCVNLLTSLAINVVISATIKALVLSTYTIGSIIFVSTLAFSYLLTISKSSTCFLLYFKLFYNCKIYLSFSLSVSLS